MRAFNIGFIASLSFLLVLSVMFLTLGFYLVPQGPAYPVYPSTQPSSYNTDGSYTNEQNAVYAKYDSDVKKYEDESKGFMKDRFLPYIQNVFVGWVIVLMFFEIIAIICAKFISPVVGGAYAFTGVWAVFGGPIFGMILMSVFGFSNVPTSEETASAIEAMYKMVGIASLLGSAVLTVIGLKLLPIPKDTN